MKNKIFRSFTSLEFSLVLVSAAILLTVGQASAQCPATELTSGLRLPLSITQSNQENLLVSESGTRTPNMGRISIIDLTGNRRTLVDGLPSGINDVNEISGPSGLFMRGRTLYALIGVGDVAIGGPPGTGTSLVNPNPPSSPLFSSVIALHFSADVEKNTSGFSLSLADQQALAGGEQVTLTNDLNEKLTIELIADFPNYTPNPTTAVPGNVRLSNPFDLVVVGDQIYLTDGGQNMVRKVDIPTGAFSVLASFGQVANPLTPLGPPFIDAVPTGIRYVDGQLLVTLLRGVPFPPGTSNVQVVDPESGTQAPLITGLKTAIDVLAFNDGDDTDHLVLQHASMGPFFGSPGVLLRFATPSSAPTVVASCFTRPTSMVLDEKTGMVYITEFAGRVVGISVAP
jgi:hypothetical protein